MASRLSNRAHTRHERTPQIWHERTPHIRQERMFDPRQMREQQGGGQRTVLSTSISQVGPAARASRRSPVSSAQSKASARAT